MARANGHKASYCKNEITLSEDGRIVLNATAVCDRKSFNGEQLFFRQYEGGLCECRNLIYNRLCGYLVCFEGDLYYQGEEWDEVCEGVNPHVFSDCGRPSPSEICVVTDKYPDFAEVLKRWKPYSRMSLMDGLNAWLNDRDAGIWLSYGLDKVAMGKQIYTSKSVQEVVRKYVSVISKKNRFYWSVKDFKTVDSLVSLGMDRKTAVERVHDKAFFNDWMKERFSEFYTLLFSNGYCCNGMSVSEWQSLCKSYLSDPLLFKELLGCGVELFALQRTRFEKIRKNRDFRYVLKKWKCTDGKLFDRAFLSWQSHRECEYLLASGFEKLATEDSERFFSLGIDRKKVLGALKLMAESKSTSLRAFVTAGRVEALCRLLDSGFDSDGTTVRLAESEWSSFKEMTPVFYNWIKRQWEDYGCDVTYHRYMRYVSDCQMVNHDVVGNDYWKMPKNFKRKERYVAREVKAFEDMKEEEKNRERSKKLLEINGKFERKAVGGFSVYVPTDCSQIARQADVLHQCLVSCNYAQKCINREVILMFMEKNGVPVATAEVKKEKEKFVIGQFYTDELDRNNCLPTSDMRDAMDEYVGIQKDNISAFFKKGKVA